MSHDRVGADEFAVTHEFLGQILGSRRAKVTLSAESLRAGLITYFRGRVTIIDRVGLEVAACECYRTITDRVKSIARSSLRDFAKESPNIVDVIDRRVVLV